MRKSIFIILILFIGCTQAPKRKNFKYGTCYEAAYCEYLKTKRPGVDCSKKVDDCSKVRTMGDCIELTEKKVDPSFTFQACWDKLR